MFNNKVQAVIIALDYNVNYHKIATACYHIMQGASFVALSKEHSILMNKKKFPGPGVVVDSIKSVTKKEPILLGKPETIACEFLIKENKLKKERCLMIGDSLTSDI